jgi:hypothetical protein
VNGMTGGIILVTMTLLGAGAPAGASDEPVPGTRLTIKSRDGRERLSFSAKGSFTIPEAGGPDDPSSAGARLELTNPGSGESFSFDLPQTHWEAARGGFRYRDADLVESGRVKIALVGARVLKISGKRAGITLDEPSQGTLIAVLTVGSFRYCARFDDGSITRDEAGSFSARNAPPPASCPSASTTTTLVTIPSLTTTTLPALGHLAFTIGAGTTSCGGPGLVPPPSAPFAGEVDNLDGSKRADLGLGCLYVGGGSPGLLPPSSIPDGSTSVLAVTGVSGTTLTLGPDAGSGPADCTLGGGPDRQCINGAPGTDGTGACTADSQCTGSNPTGACDLRANCFFGAPVPVAVPTLSTLSVCILNAIGVGASGSSDLTTQQTLVSTTLSSRIYLTGNASSPCPQCVSGVCSYGARANQSCSGGVGSKNTTLECPPDPTIYQGRLTVALAPITTATSTLFSPSGGFCGGQAHAGAFGGEAGRITVMGSPLGSNLLDPLATTLAGIFCIPSTGNPLIDGLTDLPAPGAVSVPGTASLDLPLPLP